jgi:hypothetical protein
LAAADKSSWVLRHFYYKLSNWKNIPCYHDTGSLIITENVPCSDFFSVWNVHFLWISVSMEYLSLHLTFIHYIVTYLGSAGTNPSTQGLVLVLSSQVFYLLSHTSQPLCLHLKWTSCRQQIVESWFCSVWWFLSFNRCI